MTNKHIELPALSDDQIDAIYREVWSTVVHAKRLTAFARAIEIAAIAAHEQARVVGEPVAHVAGDDAKRYLQWANVAAFDFPVGTPVYAAPQEAQADLIYALCARIKAADDAAAENDYMLDSDDCISVIRGTWEGPVLNDQPSAPVAQPATEQAEAPRKYAEFWERFPAYLIDHCEGEIVGEEMLQRAAADLYAEFPALVASGLKPFGLLLLEERATTRNLLNALREATEQPTFMGEPVSQRTATQPTASNAGERELDLYDEIECDMPSLFGRASLEGHESGQRLAHQVRTKMQAARSALASKPPAGCTHQYHYFGDQQYLRRCTGGIVHSDGNIFFTNIDKLRAALRASSPADTREPLTDKHASDLHGAIMNLQIPVDPKLPADTGVMLAYKLGHRDARHAAAELVTKEST